MQTSRTVGLVHLHVGSFLLAAWAVDTLSMVALRSSVLARVASGVPFGSDITRTSRDDETDCAANVVTRSACTVRTTVLLFSKTGCSRATSALARMLRFRFNIILGFGLVSSL